MNELIVTRSDELRRIISDEVNRVLTNVQPKTSPTQRDVFTNKQAMELLHVSRSTLQRWRNEGKLPYRQVSGKILYKRSDIDQLLEGSAKIGEK